MRQPVVAGRFYPGERDTLSSSVNELFPPATPGKEKKKAVAIISPHAGYIYSGALAAETISSIDVPETVIIIGPNHHGQGAPIALSLEDWEMPGGIAYNNKEFSSLLLKNCPQLKDDVIAHKDEHSLEVQIPFLQALQKNLSIVPIAISRISFSMCKEIAVALAQSIEEFQKDTLILASTDMNHYESRSTSNKKNEKALQAIRVMDPAELYQTVLDNRISMCGMIPVVISMIAAQLLGATSSSIVGYTDSGYVSGDTDQVVGYAGVVIS